MEYSKYPQTANGAPRFTKFYVFDKDGHLVNRAELDNRGDKYVPGLCIVCHGGTVPGDINAATPPGNTESRFIPFDLKSFDSSPVHTAGFPAMLPRNVQEESFRKMNEGIYLLSPATDAQKSLIEGWYSNVSNVGDTQGDDQAHIPFNWNTAADASFYYDVIRPSCRGCHASRTSDLDFNAPTTFPGAQAKGAVCDGGYMPQSFVAWRNLWHSTSPHQPSRIEDYLGGTCNGP
jgi:hypothetical protein